MVGKVAAPASKEAAKTAAPTKVVVDNTRRSPSGHIDYSALDRPAHLRANTSSNAVATAPLADKDLEYLDIPAFLRRQAD
jgi:cell division protein FtsZ